jgi:hypothetical protein
MSPRTRAIIRLALLALVACGAPAATPAPPTPAAEGRYARLDVGADYATYRRLTTAPFLSAVHGDRWVHVYVNEVGADAYLLGTPIPVGTIIVKESWEGRDGRASSVPGPIFVMEKRAAGYDADHEDWWYAIHWAEPTPAQRAKLGGPIYWRGKSPKVAYCYDCHDSYDRGLGGLVPTGVLMR